jgi:hypothetical protein
MGARRSCDSNSVKPNNQQSKTNAHPHELDRVGLGMNASFLSYALDGENILINVPD